MKRVMITGGAGFLGSNLCRKLLREQPETEVLCVDNFYTGRRVNIELLLSHPRFRLIEHDVTEPIEFDEGLDEIYHLACPASPPHYQKDPVYTTKTNVLGILNILELARNHEATILQASTSEVYGDPAVHPQKEDYRGNVSCTGIRACYDEGKRCAESLVFDYHRMYGTKVKVVRIFNTYGPNMDPQDGRVISNFIVQALTGKELTIYGDGSQTRSLCYVDDLLDGFVRMIASGDDFVGPVNLGNPEEYTVKEIAGLVKELTETNSKLEYVSLPQDDPTQRRPDITLAQKALGWSPAVSAKEGLKRTIQYFRTAI